MSAGADQPFAATCQYLKNVGRQVAVKLLEGEPITERADWLQTQMKRRSKCVKNDALKDENSKEWVEEIFTPPYEKIKETKVIISK